MNICVVGGGTAGWLTALYAKKVFPEYNITVVESDSIGILGAGEGSTPALTTFLRFLDINLDDLFFDTKATMKQGIKFSGWSKNNPPFFNGFHSNDFLIPNPTIDIGNHFTKIDLREVDFVHYANNEDQSQYDLALMAAEENKLVFSLRTDGRARIFKNSYQEYAGTSIHFDARLMAKKLANIGLNKGINIVEGKVTTINQNNDGNITNLVLDNNTTINTDFIFDCTGFARLFIGKTFGAKWISFNKHLPTNKAMPFFLNINENEIPPYTEAIAMDYGWMWKIPLQHRYGCGYVYDSRLISDDDAKLEIEKVVGHSIEVPKTFNFEPGHFDKIWIKNCVAIGLSSGFVEPLEATSIWQSIIVLRRFFSNKENIFNKSETARNFFNKQYKQECDDVLDFLYLHYMTDKDNTIFWKNFIENNDMPETLKEKVGLMNESYFGISEKEEMFNSVQYYKIAYGTNILNLNTVKKIYELNQMQETYSLVKKIDIEKRDFIKQLVPHSLFIQHGINFYTNVEKSKND